MSRAGFFIGILIVLGLVGSTMIFTVDQRQIAVLYAFGEVREIINAPADESAAADASANVSGAGLHFKLPPPFRVVKYIDRRIQTLDQPEPNQIYIRGNSIGLVVDWFVKWRVVDAREFIRSIGGVNVTQAETILASNVRRILDVEVAKRSEVQDVLDNDRQAIMQAVINGLEPIAKEMGVMIIDVRMRRVDYTASTAPMIFEQMSTERKSVAEKFRAEGNALKETIQASADRVYNVKVAEAYSRAQDIKGEGDAEVTRLYAEAFGKDAAFAEFYRSLQAYRESFNEKSDIMVLNQDGEFFKYMRTPMQEGKTPVSE